MPSAQSSPIPTHVLRPRSTTEFDGADAATRRAGLGYAMLRALGAHERLSGTALSVIARWSAEYGASHGGVTPDPMNLRGQDFQQRVGPALGAAEAARNAACYPGGRGARPPYAEVFEDVWVRRRWPDLCEALAGGGSG